MLYCRGAKITINLSFNNPPRKSDGPLLFNETHRIGFVVIVRRLRKKKEESGLTTMLPRKIKELLLTYHNFILLLFHCVFFNSVTQSKATDNEEQPRETTVIFL